MTLIESLQHEKSLFTPNWFVTAGSITGAEHLRIGRNNQDGVCINLSKDRITAVVTDGCSAGRYSEVGARIGARWLASWLQDHIDTEVEIEAAVHELCAGLSDHLRLLLRGLGPRTCDKQALIADYLLFTFLVVTIDRGYARIFGVGDGLFAINGVPTHLDPGINNAPPYIGYNLVDPHQLPQDVPHPCAVHHEVTLSEDVDSILIGTDGLGDLDPETLQELCSHERYLRNPMLLQRRLNVLSRGLKDDTTAVIIRRRPGQ